jgi:hypothetical protein
LALALDFSTDSPSAGQLGAQASKLDDMTAIHDTSRAAHVRDVHLRAVEPTRHATLEQLRRRRTRADQFERLRMFAATRARPPVFAYWSAALIHGLPLLEPPPGTIHVVAAGRTEGAASGVVTHARDQPSCAVVKQGLRATSVAKTVADLAGRTSFLQGVALADAALSTGTWGERTPLATRQDLEEAASAVRDPHERRRAVASVRFADGRAESALESVSRATIALAGAPPPALQLAVPALFGPSARLDFAWPELGVAGEADGAAKLHHPAFRRGRDAWGLLAERAARERRVEAAGWRFVCWQWATGRRVDKMSELLVRHGIPLDRAGRIAALGL